MPYDGGYYLISEPLLHAGIHKHTAALTNPVSPAHLDALNKIQGTPWRTNNWVLDVMRETWVSGSTLGGLPSAEDLPVPDRKTDEEWAAMSPEDQSKWKRMLSEIHGKNATAVSSRQTFLSKLSIAEELRNELEVYFPHFVDFRLRMYPQCQDLHPQSDDIGKALLMFAEGKPLGKRGLRWLAIRLANNFGKDKLPLDERVDWVFAHNAAIIDSGTDPLDGQRFWATADEPWQALASCREWALAMELDDPLTFVSHLPVPMDGSCNGLQHLSAMGRDRRGAIATNVANNQTREDIYLQVCEVVKRLVSEDAVAGNELAHEWVGKVDRSVVKRAVMTTPYGVTERGIRDQLIKDGHTEGFEAKGQAADYLKEKIVEALSETVVAAKQIMAYFQEVAKILAEANVPLTWTTPNGSKVQQAYHVLARKKVRVLSGEIILWEEDPLMQLNVGKNFLASAPNVVHSFDACHLAMTVNAAYEKGIESFCMIHDSYGTHAADTDLLAEVLREQFVEIYCVDRLQMFHEEALAQCPPGIELPEPPARGDFDVTEALESAFFFA